MKKYSLVLCLTLLTFVLSAYGKSGVERLHFIHEHDTVHLSGIQKFLPLAQNRLVLWAEQGLFVVQGTQVLLQADIPQVHDFVQVRDTLFIATEKGLYLMALAPLRPPVAREIPARNGFPPINALTLDLKKNVWIGTSGFGVFMYEQGRLKPRSGAPYISALATTPDSSVWVGTYMGVMRFTDDRMVRYAEEIASIGIAIPNNIIENLFTDRSGNLWMFMSTAVSIIPPSQMSSALHDHVDPPDYAYIGSEDNKVYNLVQSHTSNHWWLATQQGLILMTNLEIHDEEEGEHHHGLPDIITKPKADIRRFTFAETGDSVQKSDVYDLAFDKAGNMLVATDTDIWKISKATVKKWMSLTETDNHALSMKK